MSPKLVIATICISAGGKPARGDRISAGSDERACVASGHRVTHAFPVIHYVILLQELMRLKCDDRNIPQPLTILVRS